MYGSSKTTASIYGLYEGRFACIDPVHDAGVSCLSSLPTENHIVAREERQSAAFYRASMGPGVLAIHAVHHGCVAAVLMAMLVSGGTGTYCFFEPRLSVKSAM